VPLKAYKKLIDKQLLFKFVDVAAAAAAAGGQSYR